MAANFYSAWTSGPIDPAAWNALIGQLPGAHFLQTSEWGQVKQKVGWQPSQKIWQENHTQAAAAGLVLRRELTIARFGLPFRVLYVPKGPMLDWKHAILRDRVLADLEDTARQQRAIFIKIDPDVLTGEGIPGSSQAREDLTGRQLEAALLQRGWHYSPDQIQFRNTVWVDLALSKAELLQGLKQKTRYNVHLAQKKGVCVRVGTLADLPQLYQMYAETSVRDGFVIREQAYYTAVWASFMQANLAEPLIAEVEGEPVAAVIIFRFGNKAWYVYGMSRQAHREKMPNALLQWEAICRAKAAGCSVYDFWGAPEDFIESDPMWGVFRFKEGFGGKVMRMLGAWDYPIYPRLYQLYTSTLPKVLEIMRRRGRQRTKISIQ